MDDEYDIRVLKWSYAAFKQSVKELEKKKIELLVYMRTVGKEKTYYIM